MIEMKEPLKKQMKQTIKVKEVELGTGTPKICVSIIGKNLNQIREEAEHIKTLPADIVEWRLDFFEEVTDRSSIQEALVEIAGLLPKLPLMVTFRNKKEGGNKHVSPAEYAMINKKVITSGLVDLVDVELMTDESVIRELITTAKDHKVSVIISNHDFEKTPPVDIMVSRLVKAAELGGDIPKLAVMATCPKDVLSLMEATRQVREDHGIGPLITMSMGGIGTVSRLSGEIFGSALTFGSAKKASAPGQIDAAELKKILDLMHKSL